MIVHLVAPLQTATSKIEMLRKIIRITHERGHSLSENWIDPQYFRASQSEKDQHLLPWPAICREQRKLIAISDLIIAEVSGYSTFGVGYQVALAQELNKPILLISQTTPPFGAYSDGLEQENLLHQNYTDDDIEGIVIDFIESYEKPKL